MSTPLNATLPSAYLGLRIRTVPSFSNFQKFGFTNVVLCFWQVPLNPRYGIIVLTFFLFRELYLLSSSLLFSSNPTSKDLTASLSSLFPHVQAGCQACRPNVPSWMGTKHPSRLQQTTYMWNRSAPLLYMSLSHYYSYHPLTSISHHRPAQSHPSRLQQTHKLWNRSDQLLSIRPDLSSGNTGVIAPPAHHRSNLQDCSNRLICGIDFSNFT